MNFRSVNNFSKIQQIMLLTTKRRSVLLFLVGPAECAGLPGEVRRGQALRICRDWPEMPKNSGSWRIWQLGEFGRDVFGEFGKDILENLAIWKFDRRVGSKVSHAVRGGQRIQSVSAHSARPCFSLWWFVGL